MELSRKVREIMTEDRLMFVYRGEVTNENSEALLLLLEKEMESSEFTFLGRKRLFMFVLESLQNVSRHGGPDYSTMSLVVYSKTDNGYTVTTGNVISEKDEPTLKEQLNLLNSLDPSEVRKLYREKLSKTNFSAKGGAGLGLIEMAKKTGNKLDYDFIAMEDDKRYFILSKSVDEAGRSERENTTTSFSGVNIYSLEKMMAENRIAMVWSGHLTSDIEKQVLSFTETKMSEEDIEIKARRRIFSILVESLQNISRRAISLSTEEELGLPIAMISAEDKGMRLTTGNLMKTENIGQIEMKINTVNKYDKKGLKELYRNYLADSEYEEEKKDFLGLIDIARKSGHKLDYKFEKINEKFSYYTLSVLVEVNGN